MSNGHHAETARAARGDPPRLLAGDDAAARALAALAENTTIAPQIEERAWRHLRARLSEEPSFGRVHRRRSGIARALLVGAAFTAFVLLAMAPRLRRSSTRPSSPPAPTVAGQAPPPAEAPAPTSRATTAPVPLAVARPLALSERPRPLPAGASIIDGAITASASRDARATIWRDRHGRNRIALSMGQVLIDVQSQHHAGPMAVQTGDYRFIDVGTVFEVTREGRSVRLWVQAGAVEVWCRQTVLATIKAGARWSAALGDRDACRSRPPSTMPPASGPAVSVLSPVAPSAAGTPASAITPPPAEPRLSRCDSLVADGADRAAADCFSPLADGGGLIAETALYEMARLQARRFDDVAGALQTLQIQRRRFPDGALRDEADLTAIELLPRAGRHQEALDLSATFLRRHPRGSRAAELHLLRGNILRESFADYPAAAREYAAAQSADGAGGDDAAFFGAACLELSGARHEAMGAYRAYLTRSPRRHEAEARARLARLAGN